jgi:hypothetical protein
MGQTGRRSIATHILAVKIAFATAHFHSFGVALAGPWNTSVNRGRSPRDYRTTSRWGHCSKSRSLSSSKGPAGTLRASASSTVLASLGTYEALTPSICLMSLPGTPDLFESCSMLQPFAHLACCTVSPNTSTHCRDSRAALQGRVRSTESAPRISVFRAGGRAGRVIDVPESFTGRSRMSASSDLKFVIFREVTDGYRWRFSSPSGETLEYSERSHLHKDECEQEVYRLKGDRYPYAKVRHAAIG